VVTEIWLLGPDTLPAPSTARTTYWYVVLGVSPESVCVVPVTWATWVPLRKTRYPARPLPPASVDAFQDSDTEVEVLLGLVRLVGAVGGVVSPGGVPPLHDPPLTVQLAGVIPPGAPIHPKLVLAPTARVAFQVPTATTWLPDLVTLESQNEEIVAPVGRSNSTRQVTGAVVPLVIVYLPSYPEPQSEDLVNVAVSPAASAISAGTVTAATTRTAVVIRILRNLLIALSRWKLGKFPKSRSDGSHPICRCQWEWVTMGEDGVVVPLTVGFDLDMTLLDSREGIAATFRAVSARTGVHVDTDLVVSRLGPPLELELAHWFPAVEIVRTAALYRSLYRHHAILASPALAGAAEAVAAVRAAGSRVVVVTAKNEPDARRHLAHLGLPVTDVVGLAWGEGKAAALREYGAAVYVGDHVADMSAGRSAGACPVGVTTGPCTVDDLYAAGAMAVFDDLTAFPAWFDRACSGQLEDLGWATPAR